MTEKSEFVIQDLSQLLLDKSPKGILILEGNTDSNKASEDSGRKLKMKLKNILLTSAFVLSSAIFGGCATNSVEIKQANQYILRGLQYNPNPVVQVTVTTKNNFKGIDASITGFANSNLEKKEVDETDAWGELGKDTSLGYFFWGVSYIDSPVNLFPPTHETYVGGVLPLPLNPVVLAVRDLRANEGTYLETSLKNPISIGKLTLTPKVTFARNDGYGITGIQNHVEGSINLTIPIEDNVSFEATANKVHNLSEPLSKSVGDLDYNTFGLKIEW